MYKTFNKYPRLIAIVQLISALMIGGCSIWYGAWFPDAQNEHFEKAKKIDETVKKPSFWEVSKQELNLQSPVPYTVLALILGTFSGLGVLVSASRLSELEQKEKNFKAEQESHAETQQYYYDALKDHLISFFCTQIENFDDSCRASVYRHDENSHVFRLVFRHSKITRYSERGRVTLPINEGVVGATYANGDSIYIGDLQHKPGTKSHLKEINKKLEPYGSQIPEATLSKLRMPSKCYYGYAIRDVHSGEKFAILIIESTKENHFDTAEIEKLLTSQMPKVSQYVRHIAHIDSKLNPYGGA